MKRNVLNSPRLLKLKKRKRRVFLTKIILLKVLIILVFAGLAYLSRIPSLNIKEIQITGAKITDATAIKSIAEKETEGNYLWFFPKTNIFFYPKKNIREELQNKFKRLKDINISVRDRENLEISVTEREAKYLWCENDLGAGLSSETPATKEQKCYFLDDSGYLFDEAPYFSGEVYFKFFGTVFSQINFKKLLSFKKTLEVMGLLPVALYIEDNGEVRIFLSSKNASGLRPEIIFKANSDFEVIAKNLETALATEPLKSNYKNKYSSLLYIDLRFGNKVYYKFN